METKLERLPKSRIKLSINLPGKDFVKYFDQAIEKLGSNIEVKGFRPGKAPKELLIDKIGQDRILTQALELALPETYADAVKKEDQFPVAPPEIKIEQYPILGNETADLVYRAEVDVFPVIKLGDYTKVKINKDQFKPKEITEKDAEEFLGHLRKQQAKFTGVEREAQNGDRVEIDFEGRVDNVIQENMVSKNHPIILGDKTMIPGFEENLAGMKAGDEKEFEIKFPKDYHSKEIAGRQAKFKVKMNQIEEMELPILDDHFAKSLGQENVDSLKKVVLENLSKQEEEKSKELLENEVVLQALKLLEAEMPQSFLDKELERMVEDIKQKAYMQGITFEKYLEYLKKTEEELKKELVPQAEQLVKVSLLLGEIIKRENLDQKDKESPRKAVEKLLEYGTK